MKQFVYTINVTKGGQHLFAVSERSLQSIFDVVRVLSCMVYKFPEVEGYSLDVSRVPNVLGPLDVTEERIFLDVNDIMEGRIS
jgi:hypothetical protein